LPQITQISREFSRNFETTLLQEFVFIRVHWWLDLFHDAVSTQRNTAAAEAEAYIGYTAGLKACSTRLRIQQEEKWLNAPQSYLRSFASSSG
jgi:hypothetical protein